MLETSTLEEAYSLPHILVFPFLHILVFPLLHILVFYMQEVVETVFRNPLFAV